MKLDGGVVFIILFYCIATLYSHQPQGLLSLFLVHYFTLLTIQVFWTLNIDDNMRRSLYRVSLFEYDIQTTMLLFILLPWILYILIRK